VGGSLAPELQIQKLEGSSHKLPTVRDACKSQRSHTHTLFLSLTHSAGPVQESVITHTHAVSLSLSPCRTCARVSDHTRPLSLSLSLPPSPCRMRARVSESRREKLGLPLVYVPQTHKHTLSPCVSLSLTHTHARNKETSVSCAIHG